MLHSVLTIDSSQLLPWMGVFTSGMLGAAHSSPSSGATKGWSSTSHSALTGNLLLTASHDGTARLWDIDGVLTTTLRHQHPPTFAAFSPDGNRIVTGGRNRVGHIWDVASGSEIAKS